jgi:hypothetical protein
MQPPMKQIQLADGVTVSDFDTTIVCRQPLIVSVQYVRLLCILLCLHSLHHVRRLQFWRKMLHLHAHSIPQ